MDQFAVGALAAMAATTITNPLEVVKTRFQLQGELRAKGHYAVHYRNFFHAMYVIGKTDGLRGLQKGLAPALWHQLFMNGIRLGMFQLAEDHKITLKGDGQVSIPKTALVAAVGGVVTAFSGSPFFLIKVQMQAQSSKSIAVGTQHDVEGTFSEIRKIIKTQGVKGLWRGVGGSLPRRFIGSATQLTSFTLLKEFFAENNIYQIEKGFMNSFLSSMIGGIAVTVVMNPLDVISTRLYNQGVDKNGRGLLYSSYFDCVTKMYRIEGISAFYKGVVPLYIRTGPHTVLVLVFWDLLKDLQKKVKD
ncbi:solute carrier family 25 member 35-like isoform X1 [Cimex lectularius]|uniref:Solute carrier family 25 member 35 n=1 Tax=Cimex lectularius TaxID=79782 RepID=A0A8I6RB62_CIMLE|nr:solute carrier family 25 member 35-like isoform X1 [Cimex lectularius]